MFLTTSKLAKKNYGDALVQLKERLNLPIDGKDLAFLRNTCMEPYQASEAYVTKLGELFRNCVLSCIGAVSSNKLFVLSQWLSTCRHVDPSACLGPRSDVTVPLYSETN